MDLSTITVADFKALFTRGFPYLPAGGCAAGEQDKYILDSDITNAFNEAKITFNQALFSSDANIKMGYLYLTAHYLIHDLRAAQAGISGSATFNVQSRSVGSVSESYAIPEAYSKSPILSFYTTTAYGLKYLNMVYPYLVGNVVPVAGTTLP